MSVSTKQGDRAPNLPRLWNIQYLRGVAATGVVGFHAGVASGIWFNFGAFGIHLFFVISGFLMFAITDARSRPWPFLRDRLVRVVPLYWLATAAALALGFVLAAKPPAPANLLCSFLFIPCGAPGVGAHFFPLLPVGWTLNYEMLFYTAFAAMLFLPRRAQVPALVFVFILLWTLRRLGGPLSLPFGFWGNPIIFEFAAGLCLGAVWRSPHRTPLLAAVTLALAAATVGGAGAHLGSNLGPACLAGVILCAALLLERHGRDPWPVPLALGDASYSIYLWHLIAFRMFAVGVSYIHIPPAILFAAYLAVGVAAGVAAHRLIERPMLEFLKAAPWRRGAPVPGGV